MYSTQIVERYRDFRGVEDAIYWSTVETLAGANPEKLFAETGKERRLLPAEVLQRSLLLELGNLLRVFGPCALSWAVGSGSCTQKRP